MRGGLDPTPHATLGIIQVNLCWPRNTDHFCDVLIERLVPLEKCLVDQSPRETPPIQCPNPCTGQYTKPTEAPLRHLADRPPPPPPAPLRFSAAPRPNQSIGEAWSGSKSPTPRRPEERRLSNTATPRFISPSQSVATD
ncbi:hypothetical protein ZWY2020_038665 [Hordeum vulgare]|nr:hypothetical protein ZWY2020_038665 [Hordeum vulgare]